MKDKIIMVNNGGSVMEKEMAKRVAEDGAKVVITRRSLEQLEATKKKIKHREGQNLCVDMDVSDTERVQYTVDEAINTFGKIDGLVNNAAGNFICAAEELTTNGWNSVVDIVLNGTWH